MPLINWPDKAQCSPLQFLVVSLSLSLFLLFFVVFSQTGSILSYLNSLMHKFTRSPPGGTRAPLLHSCSLSCLCCNGYSLLLNSCLQIWQKQEFFMQCLQSSVPAHLSFHSALSSHGLCTTYSLVTLYPFTVSGPDPGKLLDFWDSMVLFQAPSLEKSCATTSAVQLQFQFFFVNFTLF